MKYLSNEKIVFSNNKYTFVKGCIWPNINLTCSLHSYNYCTLVCVLAAWVSVFHLACSLTFLVTSTNICARSMVDNMITNLLSSHWSATHGPSLFHSHFCDLVFASMFYHFSLKQEIPFYFQWQSHMMVYLYQTY